MTATINNPNDITQTALRPVLFGKLEPSERILQLIILKHEDGYITISEDRCSVDDVHIMVEFFYRSVRIWLKRDTGQYWPTVCHFMSSLLSCLDYSHETQRLFIGDEVGSVTEFSVADDFNRLQETKVYHPHVSGVSCVRFSLTCELVVSVGKDKKLVWHCSETGKHLGSYQLSSWVISMEFDEAAKTVFVGDYSGKILLLRITDGQIVETNALNGHAGSVQCLLWDAQSQVLFSGSQDQSVIVWDIGGKKGTVHELLGHKNKVVSLAYSAGSRTLISCSDDGLLIFWDLKARRSETPEWRSGDDCQKCSSPFFWNVKEMWSKKTVGLRQHHCRMCGAAICGSCSSHRSSIPFMGFEYPVRICDQCSETLPSKDLRSLCVMFNCKHNVITMQYDETVGKLITVGMNRVANVERPSKS